jgi:two-component system, chemotaxis family, response regulator Rcp1
MMSDMTMDNDSVFKVLLVEDNAADILLLQEAMEDIELNINLHVVHNGEEAMSFLQQAGPYLEAVRPDLILLDLNLPRKNGFTVLEEVKQDVKLQQIPVIVLSTSQAQEDIDRCYRQHANCFITKPTDLEEFLKVVKGIGQYWLNTVRLPSDRVGG